MITLIGMIVASYAIARLLERAIMLNDNPKTLHARTVLAQVILVLTVCDILYLLAQLTRASDEYLKALGR